MPITAMPPIWMRHTPDVLLIHLEIMLAAFGLLNIQYFQSVSLDYYLRLQRMALSFPENPI
jgi:hypothetical protein